MFLLILAAVSVLAANHAYAQIPNTPNFQEQWNFQNTGQFGGIPGSDINAGFAWALRTDCSPIVVAVVDSGFDYNNVALMDTVWTNPFNAGPDGKLPNGTFVGGPHGWNFADNNSDILPDFTLHPFHQTYHGTEVAGLIGVDSSDWNYNGSEVGVCWKAQIMGLKVLGKDGTAFSGQGVLNAFDYIIDMKNRGIPIKVVNLSFHGSFSRNSPSAVSEFNKLKAMRDEGILVIAAAGNDGKVPSKANNDVSDSFPSNFSTELDNVITVGSSNNVDNYSDFSQFGKNTVQLAAPGEMIPLVSKDYLFTWEEIHDPTVSALNYFFLKHLRDDFGLLSVNVTITGHTEEVRPFNIFLSEVTDISKLDNNTILVNETNHDYLKIYLSQCVVSNQQGFICVPDNFLYHNAASNSTLFPLLGNPPRYYISQHGDRHDFFLGRDYQGNDFGDGTSFSAPEVAGTAALLFSDNASYTYKDVKDKILNGVHPIQSAIDKTSTSGRLDAFNALRSGQIFGRVFQDLDNNGAFTNGDIPIAGKKVTLRSIGGVIVPFVSGSSFLLPDETVTTNTTQDGTYSFPIPRGMYSVSIDPPLGLSGISTLYGENPYPFHSYVNTKFDFPLVTVPPPTGTITGKVFLDKNGNGIQDSGEPSFPTGTVVVNVNFTASSDSPCNGGVIPDGFSDQIKEDGTYSINITRNFGCELFPATVTGFVVHGIQFDKHFNITKTIQPFTVGENSVVEQDIPVTYGDLGKVSGQVVLETIFPDSFFSPNTFDINSSPHVPLAGYNVTLKAFGDMSNPNDTKTLTTTTLDNGSYFFTNVPIGKSQVFIANPPKGLALAIPFSGSYWLDNDYLFSIDNNLYIENQNFGFVDETGTVSGYVFDDANKNGLFDKGEAPWPLQTLNLQVTSSIDGNTVLSTRSTETDINGFFEFKNVQLGNVVLSTSPPSAYSSATETVPGTGMYAFTLASGQEATNKNFGYNGTITNPGKIFKIIDEPEIDLPILVNITNYFDQNSNGNHDLGEPGLANFNFEIKDANDKSISNVTTHAGGIVNYTILDSVQNPPPYSVTEIPKLGYVPTTDTFQVKVPDLNIANIVLGNPTKIAINFEFGNNRDSSLFCGKSIDKFDNVIQGTFGNDILVGTSGNDLILGQGGDDRIFGRLGNDCIIAEDGNNYISGGAGNDTIIAGNGNNRIWGGQGDDNMTAGNGDNRIVAGSSIGGDLITVGTGNNTIWAGPGTVGHDVIQGGGGYNRCVSYSSDTSGMTACNLIYIR